MTPAVRQMRGSYAARLEREKLRGAPKSDHLGPPSPLINGTRRSITATVTPAAPQASWASAHSASRQSVTDHPRARRMARLAVVIPSTPSRTSWLKRWLSLTVQAKMISLCSWIQLTRFASTRP